MEEQESTHISFSLWSDAFSIPQKLSILGATFFGTGLLPKAPGTWASLAAVCAYPLFADLMWQQQLQIIIATTLLGVFCIAQVQKKIGQRDDGRFVIDEVAGMWITVASFPADWTWLLLGFITFRALDIWKPYPTRHIDQHFHGAWGVMLDDVICGVYALAILKVIEALRVFL